MDAGKYSTLNATELNYILSEKDSDFKTNYNSTLKKTPITEMKREKK